MEEIKTVFDFINTITAAAKPAGYVIKTGNSAGKLIRNTRRARVGFKAEIEPVNGEPINVELLFSFTKGGKDDK